MNPQAGQSHRDAWGGPTPIERSEVRRLRVAVWAKDHKILQPVVGAVAVDVMQRQEKGPATPLRDPAFLAAALL